MHSVPQIINSGAKLKDSAFSNKKNHVAALLIVFDMLILIAISVGA